MPDDLTKKELAVAELVRDGLSYQQIASRLGMAPRTARVHVAAIARKINGEGGTTPYRRVMRWMLAA